MVVETDAKQFCPMQPPERQSTGVVGLDQRIGGGLIPGTLTIVVGATGIGKTQFGLQFANAGRGQEGRRGIVLDMSARGDSQSHDVYTRRLFQWALRAVDSQMHPRLDGFFDPSRQHGDYLHVFDYRGRRVTRCDLEFDEWQQWQAELNAKLRTAIAFLYGNFLQGCRRVAVDGIEPADRTADSIQFHLFEYVYHQILRKDPAWVARDLFRERFRQHAEEVEHHTYDGSQIGCILLCTSHETMLDDLISRGIHAGGILASANTLIYMGKVRDGSRMGRAMYIAKHRGSACSDEIVPYQIGPNGLVI